MNKFNNLEVAYLRVDEKTYAIKTFCNELTDFLKKLEEKFNVRLINISWTELNSTVLKRSPKELNCFGNFILNIIPVQIIYPKSYHGLIIPDLLRLYVKDYSIVIPFESIKNQLMRYEKVYWPTYTRISMYVISDSEELIERLNQTRDT